MSNYYNDSKWKQFLKESSCGNHKREPEEEFEDHEGQMARSQLLQISKSAAELMQMIDDGDELPAWVQSKLTKASDYLKAAQSSEEYDELSAALQEDCWDGYERNPDVPEGEQGSCVKKTNEGAEGGFQVGEFVYIVNGSLKGASGKVIELATTTTGEEGYVIELYSDAKMKVFGQRGDEVIAVAGDLESGGTTDGMELYDIDEAQIDEASICKAGKDWVDGKEIGGQIVSRGEDGKFNNWSARAAQIASKYCKDPNYGRGGKKKKNEAAGVTPEQFAQEHGLSVGGDGNIIVSPDQPLSLKAAKQVEEAGWSVAMKGEFLIISPKPLNEGGLGDWEKENWTHSDGTPCGGGDKDGSQSRCKPASKWKGMSKDEKAADNAKKKAGTKSGKQYVPATKKGKVTKAHTK